jgi:DNA-binding transcriptional LysR family regulator
MLPTPYAEQIRDEVHQLVTRAQAVLTPSAEADPATLERTFTLQCNDVIADALLPRIAAVLADSAPGVCLRFLGEAGTTLDELRRGRVDLQITDAAPQHPDTRSATVLTDRLAVIGRRDLPQDPSTWQGLAAVPHVVISRRGRTHDRIDDLLDGQHLCRRVAFTVPTLALALRTVAAHHLVTIAPGMLAGPALPAPLRAYALPAPTPAIPAVLAWHARHDRDAAHRWLRTLIRDTLGAIAPAPTPAPCVAPEAGAGPFPGPTPGLRPGHRPLG